LAREIGPCTGTPVFDLDDSPWLDRQVADFLRNNEVF
jgi:hypothetical protein